MSAFGHATVSPSTSRSGAYERYTLRVPNESDNPTVKIEMRFPDSVRVISFMDVPGWTVQASFDNSGRALSAVWTGSLPPKRFVELPFVAVNPQSSARITWPVIQTYANGDRAEWTGPTDSDHPASVTVIGGTTAPPAPSWPLYLSGAAILLALVAMTLAFRGNAR
jgi:hypothetical protein